MADSAASSKPVRTRQLSEKGNDLYEDTVRKYYQKLSTLKAEIEKLTQDTDISDRERDSHQSKQLGIAHNKYSEIAAEFTSYLTRVGTEDSKRELAAQQLITSNVDAKVSDAMSKIFIQDNIDSVSQGPKSTLSFNHRSVRTQSSQSSSVTALLMKKKAKAESAKVKLKFMKKEAEIIRKQADLQADLSILNTQREADEAEAEFKAITEALEGSAVCSQSLHELDVKKETISEKHSRVEKFVSDQNIILKDPCDPNHIQRSHYFPETDHVYHTSNTRPSNVKPNHQPVFQTGTQYDTPPIHLNPNAASFTPAYIQHPHTELCAEFTRFIAKKDLLLLRLRKFDDIPEHFRTWKASFQGITEELKASPLEEIDLLVQYLGPESSKFALTIRSANAGYPQKGIQRIWERLEDKYGSPETVEASLKKKLASFPKITNKDYTQLYELFDLISEIAALKEDHKYQTLLAYYDSSSGVTPIVSKLPPHLQEKWTTEAVKYKKQYGTAYPPFTHFTEFMRELAKVKNDPSFLYENSNTDTKKGDCSTRYKESTSRQNVKVRKTRTDTESPKVQEETCPLHKTKHPLNKCRLFKSKPIKERKDFVFSNGICFRCCSTQKHLAKDCPRPVRCDVCSSDGHPPALHVDFPKTPTTKNGGEGDDKVTEDTFQRNQSEVVNSCTRVCGDPNGVSKSCAKTVLVKVFPEGEPHRALRLYAIIDDQSNRSLARSRFFDHFGENSNDMEYILASCSGHAKIMGRKAVGYVIESLDGTTQLKLPPLIECDQIPDVREEIPTPNVAYHHPHLRPIANLIPDLNSEAEILLLIGRDLTAAHHVEDQCIGSQDAPFGQKLKLGWVVIGEVCLGSIHQTPYVTTNKTHTLRDGRTTLMEPCPNCFELKEDHSHHKTSFPLFYRELGDNRPGLSIEDKQFLKLMDSEMSRDSNGNWEAPLPFKPNRQKLPDNRPQAVQRARSLDASLRRNPVKQQHMMEFMGKVLDNGHAEIAPKLKDAEERWYLPLFGVYHPKKPDRIRGVFDSSAKHQGTSLNDVLMTGPDLVNSLLGILMRFRKNAVAITADIEQMFYCFKVAETHRNFLRFFWYRDNCIDSPLVEYRMTSHVFGNAPSPAVATYGLRKSVEGADQDVKEFVNRNFYVDDGLTSSTDTVTAVDLMSRTQNAILRGGNIRLHKTASNDKEVLVAFDQNDLAKDIKGLDLGKDILPPQRSLGLIWDINNDTFTFRVSAETQPYTRRGVLSTVNSLFDPIGFVAPVVVKGKILLRDLFTSTQDWDDPLPPDGRSRWEAWRDSLKALEALSVPRLYTSISGKDISCRELHTFADASREAIGAVSYLKTVHQNGTYEISFVHGKAKLAPRKGHTIPRLELCAAVLAVEVARSAVEQLDMNLSSVHYYTDSRVVLGYIHNEKRRFYVYVGNRIDVIRNASKPEHWKYVPTGDNPADLATRSVEAKDMPDSPWLRGPLFLAKDNSPSEHFPLIEEEADKEVRPLATSLKTSMSKPHLDVSRFGRFSTWNKLVKAVAFLKHVSRTFKEKNNECHGWHQCTMYKTTTLFSEAEYVIIREVQHNAYPQEMDRLSQGQAILCSSSLLPLSPFLDSHGILRVGGRLNKSKDMTPEKNPIIIPKGQHIGTLLVRHYHNKVKHQGRLFTEGAIRSAGFWIVGGKRLISSVLRQCVICRKLRGGLEWQKMSDLPEDRQEPSPPFTYVGVDTFGPWSIVTRRTRGGVANAKRWAIMFTCLSTRAVHLEVVEEMSTSSFINALRRFMAIRGHVKHFRSDRGTNFVGAVHELMIKEIVTEDGPVKDFLLNNRVTWIFNPPHSSHMGGAWERLIGVSRKILNSMLMEANNKNLTHEVLETLLCEVSAIINSRPITTVSTDPEAPAVLTPAMLLTQKTNHVDTPCVTLDTKTCTVVSGRVFRCWLITFGENGGRSIFLDFNEDLNGSVNVQILKRAILFS